LPREAPVDEVQGDGELAAAGKGGLAFNEVEEKLFEAGGAVGVRAWGDDDGGGGEAGGGFLGLLRGARGLARGTGLGRGG